MWRPVGAGIPGVTFMDLLETIPHPSAGSTPSFLLRNNLFPMGKLIRDEMFFSGSVQCFPCGTHRSGQSVEIRILIQETQGGD